MIERLNESLEGRYRIERELGQGGMATVYLAHDMKHSRQVAVKVLRPELAAVVGAERFLAEIKTTANLQHPHILPLFDSGEADSFLFYVMPYVEGESLRERLEREKQLPVEEAVAITSKVAGALQAAHDRGVIHRDIKPANILLQEGEPLVADFGIALAVQEAGGGRLTETGLSLGTPFYMSPEQASADRHPDARSDIYSVGCVLYEMLAGDPPHTASTAQAVMAKILTQDPAPVTRSRRSVPEHVAAALNVALQRLAADRFTRAADFAAALEGRLDVSALGGRSGGSAAARPHGRIWPGVAAAATVAALWGWFGRDPGSVDQPPSHLAVPVHNVGGTAVASRIQLALTPDGSTLLYNAVTPDGSGTGTWRRDLHETESRVLAGVRPTVTNYAISPDGTEFVGMTTEGRIYRYSVDGGNERPVPVQAAEPWYTWAEDGSLWFSNDAREPMTRIDPSGTVSQPLSNEFFGMTVQQVLPGSETALSVHAPRGTSSGPLVAIDLSTGAADTLMGTDIAAARFTAGYLVYALPDGVLEAVPFDASTPAITGEPVRLAEGVLVEQGAAQMAVARNGTVAYIPGESRDLVLVTRDGSVREVTTADRNFHAPAFSPDGQRIAVDFSSAEGRNVWIVDVDEGIPTRATFDPNGHDPRWTPDGEHLTYLADVSGDPGFGIFRTRPGSMASDSVLASPKVNYTGVWLSDGSAIVSTVDEMEPGSDSDVTLVRNGGQGPVEPLVATRFSEGWPAVSPDDRWLAYTSDRSGRFEVYVRPLEGGDQIQVSQSGGREPLWSRDGRELFYRAGPGAGSELVAARIQTEPTLRVLSREALFPVADMAVGTPHVNYDVSPDGQTFVMVRFNPSSRIMVIQNLPELVRRRRGGG